MEVSGNFRLWPLCLQGRNMVSIVQKDGWVPEGLWTFAEEKYLLLPTEVQTTVRQTKASASRYTDYASPVQ
jgi:hypothetical protein